MTAQFQVPARHLVKVAGFLVEEHQDEFLGQAELLSCRTVCYRSHQSWSPRGIAASAMPFEFSETTLEYIIGPLGERCAG